MTKEVSTWADGAMFRAEPVDTSGPKVYLLEMTSDPLGSIAALSAMYTGKVTRSKDDVTDEERAHHLREMQLTKLTTPLESVKLHFMIEGVTRAFTHQLVRNRTSAYAQESMRFAVKEDMPVALPPSLRGTDDCNSFFDPSWLSPISDDDVNETFWTRNDHELAKSDFGRLSEKEKMRVIWDNTVDHISDSYNRLVDMGMPAEDARGLAPTNVLTRINWVTDLRTLIDVLGVRLCTQAQFEWRLIATLIAKSISEAYQMDRRYIFNETMAIKDHKLPESQVDGYSEHNERIVLEYQAIASMFRPICYKTGKCEFKSDADRACSIRSRVEANHDIGRRSSEWGEEYDKVDPTEVGMFNPNLRTGRDPYGTPKFIGAIKPAEWMLDPAAAR